MKETKLKEPPEILNKIRKMMDFQTMKNVGVPKKIYVELEKYEELEKYIGYWSREVKNREPLYAWSGEEVGILLFGVPAIPNKKTKIIWGKYEDR